VEPKRIAVVGAGLMGTNIALDFALAGYPVRITDASAEQRLRSAETAAANLRLLEQHGALAEPVEAVLSRIEGDASVAAAVDGADLVIEAVSENLELKRALFREIGDYAPQDAVLASNTSSFVPSLLSDATGRPERFLVAHYWNPAHLIPLVELVPSSETSPEVVQSLCALYERLGKKPVVVRKEVLGFIGNRLQFALLREALSLVESGVATPEDIDTVVRSSFGRRLPVTGLFHTADLAGLDVLLAICRVLFPDLATDGAPGSAMSDLVAAGRLGAKTDAGWFTYAPGEADALRATLGAELIRQRGAGE
jgi:3-hydroxybutyryl-CoA dehydrogenase